MTRINIIISASIALIFCITSSLPVSAQIPETTKNLQVFPKDIERSELINNMRHLSFALGVRCQYCHSGGDGISFEGVVFESDENPNKDKARFMMRMTENLNRQVLPLIPQRDEPAMEISCKTCHRGQAKPTLITQAMGMVLDDEGAEAAVARYRELRENFAMSGSFDFGEWEVNTLAERLSKEGRHQDAITIYELNRAFYPESKSIVMSLGGLYEAVENIDSAIRMYERMIEIDPDAAQSATARLRLKALKE